MVGGLFHVMPDPDFSLRRRRGKSRIILWTIQNDLKLRPTAPDKPKNTVKHVARAQARSAVIRGNNASPDYAALHPGYVFYCSLSP
jgi:hypothetical protein